MFREKEDDMHRISTSSGEATVLNQDASFEGKLIFEGRVVVNGKFTGDIISSGELTVGKTGHIEGKIEIGTIHIFGEVFGNIKAKQKIEINDPAVVRGDIMAPSLIIKEGAVFEGNCSMGSANRNADNILKLKNDESLI